MRSELFQAMLETIAAAYQAEPDPMGPHTARTLMSTPSPVAFDLVAPCALDSGTLSAVSERLIAYQTSAAAHSPAPVIASQIHRPRRRDPSCKVRAISSLFLSIRNPESHFVQNVASSTRCHHDLDQPKKNYFLVSANVRNV